MKINTFPYSELGESELMEDEDLVVVKESKYSNLE
jgi:hypothetical protein